MIHIEFKIRDTIDQNKGLKIKIWYFIFVVILSIYNLQSVERTKIIFDKVLNYRLEFTHWVDDNEVKIDERTKTVYMSERDFLNKRWDIFVWYFIVAIDMAFNQENKKPYPWYCPINPNHKKYRLIKYMTIPIVNRLKITNFVINGEEKFSFLKPFMTNTKYMD